MLARHTKRPVTAREPSGRVQREREYPSSQIKRLRDAAMMGLRDEQWGTELGRLNLEKTITDTQYMAGRRWREQAARYRQAIGVFPLRSSTGEQVGRSMAPDPDSDEGRAQAQREGNAMEQFFAGEAVLMAVNAEMVVRHLCENDRSLCGISEIKIARRGLDALASHYGLLTNQPK